MTTIPVAILLIALTMSAGCFPMGMPERFADLNAISPAHKTLKSFSPGARTKLRIHSPRVLLLVSQPAQEVPAQDGASPASLGNQYLFGIFPLTWLYLQHSPETMLLETSIALLQQNGADVFVTDAKHAAAAKLALQPAFTMQAELQDLSVNAYDAFFFRILRIEGELELQFSPAADSLPDTSVHEISKTKYSTGGHAPTLALLLESALRETIRGNYLPLLNSRPAGRPRAMSENAISASAFLLIEPPSFLKQPDPELGLMLAQSYGFSSGGSYTDGQLLRLMQRGFNQAAANAGLIAATSSANNIPLNKPAWLLKASVLKVEALENSAIAVDVNFSLLSAAQGPQSKPFFEAQCYVKQELKSFDGAPVVALERAAQKAASAFLDRDNTVCK